MAHVLPVSGFAAVCPTRTAANQRSPGVVSSRCHNPETAQVPANGAPTPAER